jgi:hypothetical protein
MKKMDKSRIPDHMKRMGASFSQQARIESSEFSQLQNTLEKDETASNSTTSFFFLQARS